MTPLHFEELYQGEWQELEGLLDQLLRRKKTTSAPVQGDRVAVLYRRACEHLALARARSYPAYLLDQLERLTADAHQVIYQRREFGLTKVRHFLNVDFPRTVRANAGYVWLSAALLYVPTMVIGWLVYVRPELILSVVDASTAASFEQMYSDSATAIGREAQGDLVMFGFYIRNNISVAFQCFAGGLFAGIELNGAVIKQDKDSTREFYTRMVPFKTSLNGLVDPPTASQPFLDSLYKWSKQAGDR